MTTRRIKEDYGIPHSTAVDNFCKQFKIPYSSLEYEYSDDYNADSFIYSGNRVNKIFASMKDNMEHIYPDTFANDDVLVVNEQDSDSNSIRIIPRKRYKDSDLSVMAESIKNNKMKVSDLFESLKESDKKRVVTMMRRLNESHGRDEIEDILDIIENAGYELQCTSNACLVYNENGTVVCEISYPRKQPQVQEY